MGTYKAPGTSRKVLGRSWDKAGPRDLEGPGTFWSRELTSPKVPGLENWKNPGTINGKHSPHPHVQQQIN